MNCPMDKFQMVLIEKHKPDLSFYFCLKCGKTVKKEVEWIE